MQPSLPIHRPGGHEWQNLFEHSMIVTDAELAGIAEPSLPTGLTCVESFCDV
jgi:hypothetical protein